MSGAQEENSVQAIPWAVILTVATLALVSAYLVFWEKWAPWQAVLVVGGAATGMILILLVAILFLSPDNRSENWRVFISTLQNDLDAMLKYFRLRKRR
ncbi:MAG: hypothetical protein M1547_02985 [Gammaproteobacteria bacterium]|nr:hypothetical protein [Gammaproteobacteria bacterium]